MIQLEFITKTYIIAQGNQVQALKGIDLWVNKGEFVVITGRSGSGKTTLLNITAGMTAPSGGKVMVDGLDLWSLNDDQQSALRSKKIGFIFQFPSLHPNLDALENVTLPTIFSRRFNPAQVNSRAEALLGQVGLADKLTSYPRQLSAGQQQRVVVARALMLQPEILLADEPTSNLDEHTEREMMALLRSIYEATGITILLVTHNSALTAYGTRAITMAEGLIVSDTTR
ncbi:MAG: ABC transporter ATP-binding protein [Anaerolineae bacterium]